ncbi:MAG: hypothetical protein BKP49_01430 [Treponema sp. CETP13]|nr:MAG: hypothetical protein BKP49_01430 [Treponema sp. CETP13]
MKNKITLIILFIFLIFSIFAQESDTSMDVDDIFNTAEDIQVEESPTPEPVFSDANELTESLKTIKFTGNLSSTIGFEQNIYPDFEYAEAGLTLENNLSFYSRASDIFGVHGNFYISFDGEDIDYKLNRFYFDYLLADIYLQVGKRSISWGNTKHSWQTDDDDDYIILPDSISQDLNIISDSSENLTISMTKYFGASDVNLLALYNTDWDADEGVTSDKISIATKANIVTGPLATTVFARKWATGDSDNDRYPVFGIDFTTAYKEFELYSHNNFEFETDEDTIFALPLNPISTSYALGVWRKWDEPRVAFNVEYALGWNEDDGYEPAIAVDFGLSHLFNNTSRIGFSFETNWDSFAITPVYEFYDLTSATFDISFPIEYIDNEFSVTMDMGLVFDFDY